MSLLAPLYVLGALAVAAPIVFHLIRRAPKGEVPFSSLMFLSPTPPRLTRRSRLDDWLLLLLRAAALLLLAFAFARPFLREAVALDSGDDERRRVAVLVDTSASMRRGDLWDRAKRAADEAIAACRPGDELSVYAFDDATRPLFTFAESATLDADRRKAVARARLKDLRPTWRGTDLGRALVDAVGSLDDVSDAGEKAGRMPRRVVLVTDLQQGSRVDALGAFEWPKDVDLELKAVAAEGANAGLQRLDDAANEDRRDAAGSLRIRVTNDAESDREKFTLNPLDAAGKPAGPPIEAYVPPGQSRVLRVPSSERMSQLRLEGDRQAFDNTFYVAADPKQEATVLYVGEDTADDPSGLLYFLERVFEDSPRQTVQVRRASPAEPIDIEAAGTVPLIVLTSRISDEKASRLRSFAEAGGTVLAVLRTPEQAASLAAFSDVDSVEASEAKVDGDVMLGEIDFGHPLFAPFAGPQFNDFTKIRFWRYRKVDPAALGDARALARFENGEPAVLEKPLGKGRLIAFTSSWATDDSQLARSSKFVPLMAALLDLSGPTASDMTALTVGTAIPVPAAGPEVVRVRKPDGTSAAVESGEAAFTATDRPGVYTVESAAGPSPFAVNLDPAESRTSPLPVETLRQLGVRMAGGGEAEVTPEQRRQMLNAELEGRQKLWRWGILAAVGVLIAETWLAGRVGRPRGEVAAS